MKHFLYFLLITFLSACTSNTIYDKPEDLIPKDTMQLLLTDMYLASASKNVKNKFSKKRKTYLPLIYKKYNIDSTRFFNSNNYYTSKIEDYNDILTVVKNKIEAENNFYQSEFKKKDSIKKLKKKAKRKAKKYFDSIRKAQKRKDYIPLILQKFKGDSIRFFNDVDLYNPYIKDYNYIISKEDILDEKLVKNKKKSKIKKSE